MTGRILPTAANNMYRDNILAKPVNFKSIKRYFIRSLFSTVVQRKHHCNITERNVLEFSTFVMNIYFHFDRYKIFTMIRVI